MVVYRKTCRLNDENIKATYAFFDVDRISPSSENWRDIESFPSGIPAAFAIFSAIAWFELSENNFMFFLSLIEPNVPKDNSFNFLITILSKYRIFQLFGKF